MGHSSVRGICVVNDIVGSHNVAILFGPCAKLFDYLMMIQERIHTVNRLVKNLNDLTLLETGHYILLNGENIWVEPNVENGSLFKFSIPVKA